MREVWIEIIKIAEGEIGYLSLPVREVWIEIIRWPMTRYGLASLPVREVWIEIFTISPMLSASFVTSREGSVDWNQRLRHTDQIRWCHFPWGKCGLKYLLMVQMMQMIWSLPVREVWIEIGYQSAARNLGGVTSREGSVDWNYPSRTCDSARRKSLPVREVWIEIVEVNPLWAVVPVTSREGSVDWNPARLILVRCPVVTSREGSVDWKKIFFVK